MTFKQALATLAAVAFSATAFAQLPTVAGEVRTVDKQAKKLTIKHGPIPNLNMDGMTMVFSVADPAVLDRVKAGDQIKFTADKVKGEYTVMSVVPPR